MKYKAVIFDFDGVIGSGLFYESTLSDKYPEVYDWIQENIFGKPEITDSWMRGEIASEDINAIISTNCAIDHRYLLKLYEQSVKNMRFNNDVLECARAFKKEGVKIAIVSNNMDVFSRITARRRDLADIFEIIVNSSDYGMLKKDNDGELYRIALGKLKAEAKDSLLIDDSLAAIDIFSKLGGHSHHFQDAVILKKYLELA